MADDVMKFPDTWEEFEKHFGFHDIKQVYTFGNTRLIPSFRVQQWLNHLDDINRKKQLQKNKMEQVAKMFGEEHTAYWSGNKMSQVAAMFGKKLGEEFDVRVNGKLRCLMFDKQRGLLYFDGDEWRKNYAYLDWLVRGKAVIVDE